MLLHKPNATVRLELSFSLKYPPYWHEVEIPPMLHQGIDMSQFITCCKSFRSGF